jgi:hypothetical protein
VIIDEDAREFFGGVFAGDRSCATNDAVREMDAMRADLPKVSTDEVATWVREDREHGHLAAEAWPR